MRLCCWPLAAACTTASAQTKVRLAVGGQTALFYLPLTVTDRLGYFKDEGLDVTISDLAGGARALQALMGGSADVVTGSFDHTIQMHAKSQPLTAVVQLGRFPGFVLALVGPKAASYRGPADLKGMKIGVTAPGSSTHFMVLHMMAQAGLKPDDASYVSVGAGQTAIAAARRGEIDALVSVDPVINLLDSEKAIRIVADTRTVEGTRQVYGGLYPAAALYLSPAYAQKNPAAVQSLANAFVRGLKWIAGHSAEEVAKCHAAGARARQHGPVRPLDPQQHADVFAGRALQPRGRGNRAQGAARIRSRGSQRQYRSGCHLHRGLRRQGSSPVKFSPIIRKCSA